MSLTTSELDAVDTQRPEDGRCLKKSQAGFKESGQRATSEDMAKGGPLREGPLWTGTEQVSGSPQAPSWASPSSFGDLSLLWMKNVWTQHQTGGGDEERMRGTQCHPLLPEQP